MPLEIRQLIREMSLANPLWGAPRIHGELLKLGIAIGQTSVAKYMARRRGPPSQGWRTFLRNHADGIAAMDLFVVPTISFRLLYGLLILQHDRRRLLWLETTTHPTAEWIARQLTEMRSEVTSRSNWANDNSTFRVRRPIEVVVLNCWVTETNDTPCLSNSSTSLAKSATVSGLCKPVSGTGPTLQSFSRRKCYPSLETTTM